MTEKQAKSLASLLQQSKDRLFVLDAKAQRFGYSDLLAYLNGCLEHLIASDFVADEEKVNQRMAAVNAYIRKLALEEN